MDKPTCSIDGCDRPAKARTWCMRHWKRWDRTGSPTGTTRPSLSERFWPRVQPAGPFDCWLWEGPKDKKGYGHFENTTAHRIAYRLLVGDPGALELDHECRTPACVNPYHLDPVTGEVNMTRSREHRADAHRDLSGRFATINR